MPRDLGPIPLSWVPFPIRLSWRHCLRPNLNRGLSSKRTCLKINAVMPQLLMRMSSDQFDGIADFDVGLVRTPQALMIYLNRSLLLRNIKHRSQYSWVYVKRFQAESSLSRPSELRSNPDKHIYFCRNRSFATVERSSGAAFGANGMLRCAFMRENYLYHFPVALE